MKPIRTGDQVTIVMAHDLHHSQPIQSVVNGAVVLYTPCDVGDCWAFEWEGHQFTLNPNCAAFVGLVLEKTKGEILAYKMLPALDE